MATPQAIVIGCSAGGLVALETLFAGLLPELPQPIVVCCHTGSSTVDLMCELLSRHATLPVIEAHERAPLQGGVIHVAPSGYHLLVEASHRFALSVDERVSFARPSIDVLFDSAAEAYRDALIGVLLTGANSDGAEGLDRIRRCGGLAIVQDRCRSIRHARGSPGARRCRSLPSTRGYRATAQSSLPAMNLPVPKILVVDDTPANLVAMRYLLADSGAQLYEAGSGNDALALCLDHEFALILLDVNMPEMDGFEVAFLIGEDERLRDTPIIFVTAAYADDINRVRGYHFGAVDYIAKPINDMILQSKVRVFLELYRARAELKSTLVELEERNLQLNAEIAERLRIEDRIRHQATHDMLTGLPNRTLFHDRLLTAMQRVPRHGPGFALAMLDIDGFKAVNDNHGHPAGDALLKAIAQRLGDQVRSNDTVARLGGDEFALILEDVSDVDLLMRRCEEVGEALAAPYPLEGRQGPFEAKVSASIGVAIWQGDEQADEDLIQSADRALYQAKEDGKNCCVLAP
jgi:diguanylate cyclase (GGDEF)-like protein